ncbi:EipB family protein [Chelativorans sp. YIM 93263]|uniref:EipB family protein n=1 Tax=Chelativorans sp. YIM 93263 TaxID=2906648 RepID=UPI0023796FFC|nr:DUF1849 family protein [Chelativorans sp. YIM 93263]
MPIRRLALLSFASLVGTLTVTDAHVQTLQPHRAVYDLALAETSNTSDVDGLSGRWVYEFSGSACQGYTLSSRIVMRFDMVDGPRVVDQRVTSTEAPDGSSLRFRTSAFIDEVEESEVRGVARKEPSRTVVEYEEPEDVERSFGPTLFPTEQLRELLRKADEGERFYQTAIFDGTEFTDKAVAMSVVIGRPKPVGQDDPERNALDSLAADPFRPITAAYFNGEGSSDGEETSDYIVSFKLHESGIQRDMHIRYRDYAMTGTLAELSLLEMEEGCEAE